MTINTYATLAEYKAYATGRGQTAVNDTADDAVITGLLKSASRLIDQQARRKFYPRIDTHYYDIPEGRRLWLGDDLLKITSLVNGDDSAMTEYTLEDVNHPPYYAIRLRDYSIVTWESDSNNSAQNVIEVTGEWGYHDEYTQRAWVAVGTLGAAITDTTGKSATLTAGHSAVSGKTFKIDAEIFTGSISTNTLTITMRGDNGSTAATHLINAVLYQWEPMDIVHNCCLQIVQSAYKRRNGETQSDTATVTAAGVVLTPDDVPANVMRALKDLRSLT